ncbi:hypothetical protein B0H19DRAFT_1373119 [Mycena capillaripes]|nr:hypothetical protein B0H19DRAFT_1373119 [Mycena capillaripes]
MNAPGPSVSLPPELWLYVHRLATYDDSPMVVAYTERFLYVPVTDPLKDVKNFLREACSFVLVCRLWNSLANEILYENIRVDDKFHALYVALEKPGTAQLVRSVRLSTTRFDHNYAILTLCPRLQVIVQPDATSTPRPEMLVSAPSLDISTALPEFHSLKHIYWTESYLTSDVLRGLIPNAPNLEYLYLTQSTCLRVDDNFDFPAPPSLRRLGLGGVGLPRLEFVSSIFQSDLRNLTRLNCLPSLLNLPDFPALPSLRTLELFGSRSNIPFTTIFTQCPRLRELNYNVWNGVSAPEGEHSFISCVRLHSAVTVVRDWRPIENHFELFRSPAFPKLLRLVLHGSWYRVVGNPLFTQLRDGLRAQGCQLEFPEGHVC